MELNVTHAIMEYMWLLMSTYVHVHITTINTDPEVYYGHCWDIYRRSVGGALCNNDSETVLYVSVFDRKRSPAAGMATR
jgi:hypothetical protein